MFYPGGSWRNAFATERRWGAKTLGKKVKAPTKPFGTGAAARAGNKDQWRKRGRKLAKGPIFCVWGFKREDRNSETQSSMAKKGGPPRNKTLSGGKKRGGCSPEETNFVG